MSAAKEVQPLGSHSGKRGYIRVCVRCGKELQGVGRNAKYCPACRADVNREMVMDYRTRNPEKVRAAYERRKAATRFIRGECQAGSLDCMVCGGVDCTIRHCKALLGVSNDVTKRPHPKDSSGRAKNEKGRFSPLLYRDRKSVV